MYEAKKLDNKTNFPEPHTQKHSSKYSPKLLSQAAFPKFPLEIIFSSWAQGIMTLQFLLCYSKYKE